MPKFYVTLMADRIEHNKVLVEADTVEEACASALANDDGDYEPGDLGASWVEYVDNESSDDSFPVPPEHTGPPDAWRAGDLLREAVDAWPQFDTENEHVGGADLVEWFAGWRERAKQALGISNAPALVSAQSAGYSVSSSFWTVTGGAPSESWIVYRPDGDRLSDDYGTEAEAWSAAQADMRERQPVAV